MASNLTIHVNGEARAVDRETTVAELLAALKIESRHCAVEVNLELVPRALHERRRLAEGDRLEIVTLVGGG